MKRALAVFILLTATYAISLLVIPRPHASVACSVPYVFFPNTIADANQVNANFNSLLSCFARSAAAGANSDITSLSSLTTPLSVSQGGTGGTALNPQYGVVIANGSMPLAVTGVGTTGQVLTGTGGVPVWEAPSKSVKSITSNYTISSSDCGYNLVISGGQFQLAFPGGGITSPCDVSFCNADSGSGKIMTNSAPLGLRNTLYPGQCGEVTWGPSGWILAVDPGRWNIPSAAFYIGGSVAAADTNDGLSPSTPFATLGRCYAVVSVEIQTSSQGPADCLVASNALISECIYVYGPNPPSHAFVRFKGLNVGFTWQTCLPSGSFTGGTFLLTFGDNGTVILDNVVMDGSTMLHPNSTLIQGHNPGILDFGDPSDPAAPACGNTLSLKGGSNIGEMIQFNGALSTVGFGCNFNWNGPCSSFLHASHGAYITFQQITLFFTGAPCNSGAAAYFIVDSSSTILFEGAIGFNPAANSSYPGMQGYNLSSKGTIINTSSVIPGTVASFKTNSATYCTSYSDMTGC